MPCIPAEIAGPPGTRPYNRTLKPILKTRVGANLWHAAAPFYFVGITLAFVLVTLFSPNPPFLRDYGNWVYQGDIFAKALSGHPVGLYQFKHYPVPNSLVTIGLGLLTMAFGWLWAAKLWLAFSIIINSVAIFLAARAFRVREIAIWYALPGAFLFGQSFWFATLSFNLGFSLLIILAVLLCRRPQGHSAMACLLFLCFFMHLIIYAAAFVMILLYCAESRARRPLWAALATTPLAAWYIVGRLLTHSDESQIGHSSPLHIAAPVVITLVAIGVAFALPAKPLVRRITPWLVSLATLLVLVAIAEWLLSSSRKTLNSSSAMTVLQLKALAPFSLFGFINLMQTPANPPLSYSWSMLHPPVFIGLMVICILAGAAFMIAFAWRLATRARQTVSDVNSDPGRGGNAPSTNGAFPSFLWSFVALFASLYLICPPNALGVIGVDMRLAQIALGIALLLLSANTSLTLRWISPLFIVLALASLYQFHFSQNHFYLSKADTGLPNLMANFGGIEGRYMVVYERVRHDDFGGFFFDTGLFAPAPQKQISPAPTQNAP